MAPFFVEKTSIPLCTQITACSFGAARHYHIRLISRVHGRAESGSKNNERHGDGDDGDAGRPAARAARSLKLPELLVRDRSVRRFAGAAPRTRPRASRAWRASCEPARQSHRTPSTTGATQVLPKPGAGAGHLSVPGREDDGDAKLHASTVAESITNWPEVVDKLRGTRFEKYLTMDGSVLP